MHKRKKAPPKNEAIKHSSVTRHVSLHLLLIVHDFTHFHAYIHPFVMNFRTPFSFLYPIQLNFLWFIFGVGKSCGLWWEYAVPAKNPWLHLPVFYTLLCSALWKRGLGLGMFLLTERKRKFQPEFIFHLSCMGFDKGCSLVLGRLLKRKWMTFEPQSHLWCSWHKTIITQTPLH